VRVVAGKRLSAEAACLFLRSLILKGMAPGVDIDLAFPVEVLYR
jgi:hypothetical protein